MWLSAGLYLLTLEAVRFVNHFSSEFLLISPSIFGLVCVACTLLLAVGVPLRFHSRKTPVVVALVILAVAILVLGIPGLVYLSYFIPYATGNTYTLVDWIILVMLVGIAAFGLVASTSQFLRLRNEAGPTSRCRQQPPALGS